MKADKATIAYSLSDAVDTGTASLLTGEHVVTIQRKVNDGTYRAAECKSERSQKTYMVEVSSLPAAAQLKYIMQHERGNLGEADLAACREKFGEQGIMKILERRDAVLELIRAEQSSGFGGLVARKREVAGKYNVSERTLYRWKSEYQAQGLAGLLDKTQYRNKGKPKSLCLFAQDFILVQLCDPVKRSNVSVYEKLKALKSELGGGACERCAHCGGSVVRRELALRGLSERYPLCEEEARSGLIIPQNVSAVNRHVAGLPKGTLAYARHGEKYWEAHYMPKATRVKPEHINEVWFGDHHMFDLFVIDDDGCIVRPWMTAWSDAASGCFAGWCITGNPNSATIAETFVRAIVKKDASPFWGVPTAIYIDNGKDYRSRKFEGERESEHVIGKLNERLGKTGLLQTLGVDVIHAQPYKAWSKTIERLFGTLEERYIRELPGWCGNSPQNRPEDLSRARLEKMAERGQLLTLREFERVMRTQIIPAYHAERFGNAQSPIEIYERLSRIREDLPSWEVLTLIKMEAAARKVSPSGIRYGGRLYWSGELTELINEEVTIRYNPGETESVTVIHAGRFVCEAMEKERLTLVNADRRKLEEHLALQRNTKRALKGGIATAALAVGTGLRNTIYEPIDYSKAKGTITTIEYVKASQRRKEAREELNRPGRSDEAENQVRSMFRAGYEALMQEQAENQ